MKISDCRAFSPFKTLPGCRAFRHSEKNIGIQGTPISYPPYSTIHAIPYFLIGIICDPIWGSFPVRDHLRSNLGTICGPGSFADPYRSFKVVSFCSFAAFFDNFRAFPTILVSPCRKRLVYAYRCHQDVLLVQMCRLHCQQSPPFCLLT